jgi:uncharacterized protein YaaR (DUF327 family)
MTAIFAGVEFPVQEKNELIYKCGGPDRLLRVETPHGIFIYSLLDVLDAWPDLENLFPITSPDAVVKELVRLELTFRREHKPTLFTRVPHKYLDEIVKQEKLLYRNFFPQMFSPDAFLYIPEMFFRYDLFFQPDLFPQQKFEITPELFTKLEKQEFKQEFLDPELKDFEKPMFPVPAAPLTLLLQEMVAEENLELLKALPEEFQKVFERLFRNLTTKTIARHEQLAQEYLNIIITQGRTIEELYQVAFIEVHKLAEAKTNIVANQILHTVLVKIYNLFATVKEAQTWAINCVLYAKGIPGSPAMKEVIEKAELTWAAIKKTEFLAIELLKKAKEIASIGIVPLFGHVVELDPVFQRNIENATVTVRWLGIEEIPEQTVKTDLEGKFTVLGRFGYSPLLGNARLLLTCAVGREMITREIIVTSDTPAPIKLEYVPVLE